MTDHDHSNAVTGGPLTAPVLVHCASCGEEFVLNVRSLDAAKKRALTDISRRPTDYLCKRCLADSESASR